jgi:hypothetical protein
MDLVNCQESAWASSIHIFNGICELAVGREMLLWCYIILFGGQLIASEEKTGGIRPITIGYTWRRIVAKCQTAMPQHH